MATSVSNPHFQRPETMLQACSETAAASTQPAETPPVPGTAEQVRARHKAVVCVVPSGVSQSSQARKPFALYARYKVTIGL